MNDKRKIFISTVTIVFAVSLLPLLLVISHLKNESVGNVLYWLFDYNYLFPLLTVYGAVYFTVLYPERLWGWLKKREILAALVLLLPVFCYCAIFHRHNSYFALYSVLVNVLLLLLCLIVPGFYLLKLVFTRAAAFDNDSICLLSIPATITVQCIPFIVFQFVGAPSLLYLLFSLALLGKVIYAARKRKILGEIFKVSTTLKFAIIFTYAVIVIATSFVSVNGVSYQEKAKNWEMIARTGFHNLPGDNNLQYKTALTFISYKPPWVEKRWTMGDRPPLMGLVNSIVAHNLLIRNISYIYPFWFYELVGIALNSLFFIPLILICRRIFGDPGVSYFIPLAVFLNIFIFLNIYFTWPKLFGVFFILAGIALVMKHNLTSLSSFLTGSLFSLGGLCHGGALLSLPPLVLLYVLCRIKTLKLGILRYALVLLVAFALFQAPWIIYKKCHPEIDTVTLIHEHFLDENPEKIQSAEGRIYSRDLPAKIREFLLKKPLSQRVGEQFMRVRCLGSRNRFDAVFTQFCTGKFKQYFSDLYFAVFYNPISAIGEIPILLCSAVLLFFMIRSLLKRKNMFPASVDLRLTGFFVAFVLLSYLFNQSIRAGGIVNHAASYLELIMAIALTAGIIFSSSKTLRIFLIILICIKFMYYLVFRSIKLNYDVMNFYNLAAVLGIVFLFWLASRSAKKEEPKPEARMRR